MKHLHIFLYLVPVMLALQPGWAAEADFSLQEGGTVAVDPATNRATVTRDGVTTPLWDGTHRLRDGSILIIRKGISVPGEPVPEPRQRPIPEAAEWEGAPIAGYSPCEQLVRRTCGVKDRCRDSEGCDMARQLLDMERNERSENDDRNRMTYTSGQCRAHLGDRALFPACTRK